MASEYSENQDMRIAELRPERAAAVALSACTRSIPLVVSITDDQVFLKTLAGIGIYWVRTMGVILGTPVDLTTPVLPASFRGDGDVAFRAIQPWEILHYALAASSPNEATGLAKIDSSIIAAEEAYALIPNSSLTEFRAETELEIAVLSSTPPMPLEDFFSYRLWNSEPKAWSKAKEALIERCDQLQLSSDYAQLVVGKFSQVTGQHFESDWAASLQPNSSRSRVSLESDGIVNIGLAVNEPQQTPMRALRPKLNMLDDTPALEDLLGFGVYADALAQLIQAPETGTPLTIAINAPWGAGKSTLGRMVQAKIEEGRSDLQIPPYTFLWFNAWLHDGAPNLASAFAAEVTRAASMGRSPLQRILRPLPPPLWSLRAKRRFKAFVSISSIVGGLLVGVFAQERVISNPAVAVATGTGATVLIGSLIQGVRHYSSVGKKIAEFVLDPRKVAGAGSMEEVRDQLKILIEDATKPELVGRFIRTAFGLAFMRLAITIARRIDRRNAQSWTLPRDDEEFRRIIERSLSRRQRKFVVFVDDLERCRPGHSIDVLEVLNQLLCQKQVVTIVLADMESLAADAGVRHKDLAEVVEKSVNDKTPKWSTAQSFGRKYLQKIIQLQFDLPLHNPDLLKTMVMRLADDQEQVSGSNLPNTVGDPISTESVIVEGGPEVQARSKRDSRTAKMDLVLSYTFYLITTLMLAFAVLAFRDHALNVAIAAISISLVFFMIGYQVVSGDWRKASEQERIREVSKVVGANLADSSTISAEVEDQLAGLGVKMTSTTQAEIAQAAKETILADSHVLESAFSVAFHYLPGLPRNAKRLVNALRLMVYIGVERKLFDQDLLTSEQLGKWIAIRERWPELCGAIYRSPDLLTQLESASGNHGDVLALVNQVDPLFTDSIKLSEILCAEPKFNGCADVLATLSPRALGASQ